MGAGRTRADQRVDPGVGICIDAKPGARVDRGTVLARLFVRTASQAAAVAERVEAAFSIAEAAPLMRPLVLGRRGSEL
jgi:pyrimidine-nucleoside phosphorylase